jgi:hypothetical protein
MAVKSTVNFRRHHILDPAGLPSSLRNPAAGQLLTVQAITS